MRVTDVIEMAVGGQDGHRTQSATAEHLVHRRLGGDPWVDDEALRGAFFGPHQITVCSPCGHFNGLNKHESTLSG